jgi:sodium-dependent dicarboxylate transporter 2/3/5
MPENELKGRDRTYGAIIGIAALAAVLIIPPPSDVPVAAWRVAGVAVLMATWWITEALPIPATALIPLVLFPQLGVSSMRGTATPYADPIIFLFLGGFIIGTGMQRWALHKRIGLRAIKLTGTSPRRLIGGFMLATALLSMWISNSATAIMMLVDLRWKISTLSSALRTCR